MNALLHRFAFLTADFADGADEKNAAASPMPSPLAPRLSPLAPLDTDDAFPM